MENSFGILRRTEEILIVTPTQYSPGKARLLQTQFEAHFLVVCSRKKPFEQALFILKEEILGGYQTCLVCPLTFELHVFPKEDNFELMWGENCQQICEILAEDSIIRHLTRHCNDYSRYQTIPFNAYSRKHRWIWYYKDYMPEIFFSSKSFIPFTESLIFDHYGKPIMTAYIDECLQRKKYLFATEVPVNVLVFTWNAAGLEPAGDIRNALRGISEMHPAPVVSPDFIVVGMQEICFLGKVWGDSNREQLWTGFITQQVLSAFGNEYKTVLQESLVGIHTLIFCRDVHLKFISCISSKTIKLGLKGYAGNKGAVGVRFEIYNTSICLVNVHLIHNTDKFQDRNRNIFFIQKNLKFHLSDSELAIDEHDQVIWFGDFNYRVDLPSSKIKDLVKSQNIKTALKFDQLTRARDSYAILPEYSEGEIHFWPTFKFQFGCDDYNLNRDPAWCDRILYRGAMRLLRYDCCGSVRHSDHKPVFAHFEFHGFNVDEGKKTMVLQEIFNEIDQEHHRAIPSLKISCSQIDFKSVRYKVRESLRFSVANVGFCDADFQVESEKWTACVPRSYRLSIGQTVDIEVCLNVDSDLLKAFRIKGNIFPAFIRVSVNGGTVYLVELKFEICDTFIGKSVDEICGFQGNEEGKIPENLGFLLESMERVNYVQEIFEPEHEIENLGVLVQRLEERQDLNSFTLFQIIQVFWDFVRNLKFPLIQGKVIDGLMNLVNMETPMSIIESFLAGLSQANRVVLSAVLALFLKLKMKFNLHSSYLSKNFFKVFYSKHSVSVMKRENRELFLELLITHAHKI